MEKFKKWMSRIFTAVMIMFILWVVISWLNITTHNDIPNYTYPWWNFFTHLVS